MKLNNQTFSLVILSAQGGLPSLCSKQRLFEAWVSFRKVGVFFLAIGLITGSTGCFHPVATMFDSAHSLQEGQSKITVGGTGNPEGWSNPGGSVLAIYDHGITANRDVRIRFERRMESGIFSDPYAFLEFGHKWTFNNQFAFSLPAQLYFSVENGDDGDLFNGDDGDLFNGLLDGGYGNGLCVNPRFIVSSNRQERNSEFTAVLHAIVNPTENGYVLPGASVGFAFSDDWESNILRLEMAFTAPGTITFGLGSQWLFGRQKQNLPAVPDQ